MYLTLNQAAKECGRSAGTLSKAVKSGKLSVAEKSDDGSFKIDPTELFRVFPRSLETPKNEQIETPTETQATPREIEFLQQMNAQMAETIADLRRRLDDERDERQRLAIIMLEHQKNTQESKDDKVSKKKRWWQKEIKIV